MLSEIVQIVHVVRNCPNCPKLSILSKAYPNVQKCPKLSKMSKNVQFMSKDKYVQNCPKTKSPIMSNFFDNYPKCKIMSHEVSIFVQNYPKNRIMFKNDQNV